MNNITTTAKPYFDTSCIEVFQPIGPFYVFKIKATKLVNLVFSMAAYSQEGKLSGVQRKLREDRIKEIGLYCKSNNATFPNSIILSANYKKSGEYVNDEDIRWFVSGERLIIPQKIELASIIDGQHRIEGLKEAIRSNDFVDFDILCSVYLDMPFSQQAEVFTSINFNQKKVDKSIAYELFGYDLDNTDKQFWSPDTLAVYFARVLNNDNNSFLKGRIHTAINGNVKNQDWFVSTACIVECITLLISTDATKDRYTIHQNSFINKGRKRLKSIKSDSPLRALYIEGKDKDIFDIVSIFLSKINSLGWFNSKDLVTTKTIGFLALFEILRDILKDKEEKVLTLADLAFLDNVEIELLKKSEYSFSGIGKGQLKQVLLG
ncbi:hypothetical protein PESP_b0132 [Pseudoalteromonas espejiana DSM 9414]|uniref:DGQHR domain-containing protein n=1 Tax=Pseudoalteromonas espejiana TaxID=28107 RepID=A0A510XVB3_9GAMM|nr:DGQHR domain-containing protein [Pseudoalteromonas espejiana]ASM51750.1 hypothetical protein PESP_b0132 [Pseudoalteromonas espejiana DSM 9414]GEK54976.1 hypothetical protein PES01_18210 [Pseudoalteromonas espejiana]